jgi:CHAD domain-containing protein
MAWQPRGGGPQLTAPLKEPVGFAWDLPDPLQQALTPVIGVRRLLAQADSEEYGWLLEMLDDRGKTVARVRIESGRARLPIPRMAWQSLPTVITLTGLRGYEEVYRKLVPVIESRPGIESCPEGFHGLILQLVGVPDADVSSLRITLAPTVSADAGARQIHLALLRILAANEPGLRANLDTEFLHDFRVAVRRTRALLGQMKHVFPADVVEHFSTEFSWLGRLTGPPRDIDVLILTFREHCAEIPARDLEEVTVLLREMQEREHQTLVTALEGDRYRRLLSEWGAFLEQPASCEAQPCNARRLLADVASERAWRLCRRIARAAETIDEDAAASRMHEVRIDAKKLRYLVDVTAEFYDPADLEYILGALKKLQRVLGDFNDAHVQEERLLEYANALGPQGEHAGALRALKRLAEHSRQRREDMRKQVVKGFVRFRTRDTRSACRRTFKRAKATVRTR